MASTCSKAAAKVGPRGPPATGSASPARRADGHPAADLDLRDLAPACRAPVLPGRLPGLGEADDGVSSEPVIAALAGDDEALDELPGPARHDLEEQSVHVVVLLGPPGAPAVAGALDEGGGEFSGHCITLIVPHTPGQYATVLNCLSTTGNRNEYEG